MPYILYSLKTDRAKYLSASTVSAEGYARAREWRPRIMRVSLPSSY